MKKIQVDMFEVQLGSAMLLQFFTENQTISVLADAGVKASNYSLDHVKQKLPSALGVKEEESKRIDLIIGTHYDEDHLSGLIPIIEDATYDIGEAWMPPVANDTESRTLNDIPDDYHMLAEQFGEEDGESRFRKYIDAKSSDCAYISRLINYANKKRDETFDSLENNEQRNEWAKVSELYGELAEIVFSFKELIAQANNILRMEDQSCHAPEADVTRTIDEGIYRDPRLYRYWASRWWREEFSEEIFDERWDSFPSTIKSDIHSLAYIQRSIAKDAINATSLYRVVKALKHKKIPISCKFIQDGEPRQFVWNSISRNFQPNSAAKVAGPLLTLLGPSISLIKKHWHRLPIGHYLAKLAYYSIPVKGITPSNQLSYIAKFQYEEQSILITGDAGCVDFKLGRKNYYPELLNAMQPLHVIQVAHHAGNNAHFYRVLDESGYTKQSQESYLLISHATNDKFRPSREFGMFVEKLRKLNDNVSLLFTSKPQLKKVEDYKILIHPLKPGTGGSGSDYGDICLEYQNGWAVVKHAVKIP